MNWKFFKFAFLKEFYRSGNRGRMYNKFANDKAALATINGNKKDNTKKVLATTSSAKIDYSAAPGKDEEIVIRILKHDKITNEQFNNYWMACVKSRMRDIDVMKKEIFNKWPEYMEPSGYRLVNFLKKIIRST